MKRHIPLSCPDIGEQEIAAVTEVLRGTTLSLGPRLRAFEEHFAHYLGTRFAVAVNSGTSGLHLAVRALDIGPGDEVITTPFSFIASANCLLYEGATPVFVDIDPDTWVLDLNALEAAITPRTKAILPVHLFGLPCDMDHMMQLASAKRLAVIEDACEAIGASWGSRKVGTFGAAGVFAFYPNKQMTTGEGGMIATNDERLASLFTSLRNQGRDQFPAFTHARLGYNYRLSELQCALGLAQLARIEALLRQRAAVAARYHANLRGIKGLRLLDPPVGGTMSWYAYIVLLPEDVDRERLRGLLAEAGVASSVYFPPIHLQAFYRQRFGFRNGDFPVTESVARRTLALPFSGKMSAEDVEDVVARLTAALRDARVRV